MPASLISHRGLALGFYGIPCVPSTENKASLQVVMPNVDFMTLIWVVLSSKRVTEGKNTIEMDIPKLQKVLENGHIVLCR